MMAEIDDVSAAQAGDSAAFSRLVARFQRMVITYAAGWVGDQAEDVAQEAFVEAFLCLHQLREPGAFAGWLRRIVLKRCDRATRRRPLPVAADASAGSFDEAALERRWLLRAVAKLPESERMIVALHYLGDEPQRSIAGFLELPLSTVKKRLHSARARLRQQEQSMRPNPTSTRFSDKIAFFLAVRAGDVAEAGLILDRFPELLDMEEQWTAGEALAGGLPLAHRVTPLVLAAGRGDREMLDLLLERGADVNRPCSCRNGETALWIASRCGYRAIVERLLAAGADPERKNHAGYSAAQVGSLRAMERARTNGKRFELGIKAIDLLVPLEEGMLVRVHGAAETGLMVLLAELTNRLDGAVWASYAREPHQPWQERELAAFAAASGVRPQLGGDITGRPLFVFMDEGRQAELEAALPRLREARIAFVVDPWCEATRYGGAPELAAPYDALIVTDPELAARGIYPAIDRRRSRSIARVPSEHARVAEGVRRSGSEGVLQFIHQWFGVYQHQTGKPGEYWSLGDTLSGFSARLSA